jgi:hypothetical protein
MGEAMHKKAMELMQESVQRTAKELLRKGPRTAAEARQEHEEEEGEDGDDNDEDGEEEEEEPQLDPRHQEAMMKGLRYVPMQTRIRDTCGFDRHGGSPRDRSTEMGGHSCPASVVPTL